MRKEVKCNSKVAMPAIILPFFSGKKKKEKKSDHGKKQILIKQYTTVN